MWPMNVFDKGLTDKLIASLSILSLKAQDVGR